MASVAFLEGYHYVPRIDKELLAAHSEGLICLCGCASGEFSEFILKDQMDEARRAGRVVRTSCSARTSTSRSRTTGSTSRRLLRRGGDRHRQPARPAAGGHQRRPLPLRRTTPRPRRAAVHQHRQDSRTDENRMRYGSDQFYVRAAGGDVSSSSPSMPTPSSAARRSPTAVDIELDFKKRHFPVFTPPEGKTPEEYLRELCEAGPARALRRQRRPKRRATGWNTNWASSAAWALPAIS